MSEKPKPPVGLRAPGRRLWDSITGDYALDEHEIVLLREIVRTVDLVDELDARVRVDGAVIESPQGVKAHPAAVEARQQRITLARMLAALRMPAGDEGDKVQGRRQQRRTGARGVYSIRNGKAL
jgi:hypothetical protein